MFYVICKTTIKDNDSNIIEPSYDTKEGAIEKIMELIDNEDTFYEYKLISNCTFEVYKKSIGYLHTTKDLIHKYKILEVNEPK